RVNGFQRFYSAEVWPVQDETTVILNGIDLHYELRGEGAPLLLLHGGTGCHSDWVYAGREQFAREYKLIAPDARGRRSCRAIAIPFIRSRWPSRCTARFHSLRYGLFLMAATDQSFSMPQRSSRRLRLPSCERDPCRLPVRRHPHYTQHAMKTSRLLLAVSGAASVIFLLAGTLAAGEWPVVCKVLSILMLAALGFRVDALLGCALAVSALGDFLLGVQRVGSLDGESLFLLGLGSFLVTHLVYIAMFCKYRARDWQKLGPAQVLGVVAIFAV